jgi:hypothetical protein
VQPTTLKKIKIKAPAAAPTDEASAKPKKPKKTQTKKPKSPESAAQAAPVKKEEPILSAAEKLEKKQKTSKLQYSVLYFWHGD